MSPCNTAKKTHPALPCWAKCNLELQQGRTTTNKITISHHPITGLITYKAQKLTLLYRKVGSLFLVLNGFPLLLYNHTVRKEELLGDLWASCQVFLQAWIMQAHILWSWSEKRERKRRKERLRREVYAFCLLYPSLMFKRGNKVPMWCIQNCFC